jgi:RNA polymerase sigma factor (sigma-70 family)
MPCQSDDDELVQAYLSGQQQAFEELYQRHAQKLLTFLAGEVGRAWAEDLVQETFARLVTSLPKYDPRGHFQAYLYRIARNLARDNQRQQKPTTPLEKAEWLISTLTLDHELDRAWLLNALKNLTKEQKQVILMHDYLGLTFAEIANNFQRPLGTVLSQMHRAVANLRRQLVPAPEM